MKCKGIDEFEREELIRRIMNAETIPALQLAIIAVVERLYMNTDEESEE